MSSSNLLYRYIFHGTRLNIKPEAKQFLHELGLSNPDAWIPFNEGEVLSNGTTTCLKVQLADKCIYFKRYHYKKNLWEFFLRRSKAANELLNYQHFKEVGIPTLNTLALYETRSFGRLEAACIVTEELKNTTQLDDFYKNTLLKAPSNEQRVMLKDLNEKLFTQIRLAHNEGIFHLDLKWRNILIQQKDGVLTPIWIDCPRGIQRRFFNYRLKVAELSGLSRKALSFFSYSQLYRMLYLYLGKSATKKEARKLFFDIQKHLAKRPPKIQNR
ncbi:MAG: hypothetical protein A6F70_00945 [Cycloclasticus sp. symbiont of Bathymodiolus heckerae]|nr:MAG: hypothetical protein A6F70_00945 [Cycloclasticus sp. symbiont of Bathymodiolus heckerae]